MTSNVILRNLGRCAIRGVILLLPAALLGCGGITLRPITADEIAGLRAAADPSPGVYAIEPGDTLAINYTYHPEMIQQEVVRPDGKITATLVGEVHVAGMTTTQLQRALEQATSDRLRGPEVTVRIARHGDKQVYVGGEVGKPGLVPYQRGMTALQAVVAAGGFRETARLDTVVLVRTDRGGQNILSRTLDLEAAVTSGAEDSITLTPRDVLFVPRTRIANADLWVRQHITDLIPFFRGTGMSIPVPLF
jgi:polysaccharide biosynthesis/export protein